MSLASRSILTRSPASPKVSASPRDSLDLPPSSRLPRLGVLGASVAIQSPTPLESALTEYPERVGYTPFRISTPCSHPLVTPLESALTKNAPVSPVESALTKTPGGWGAFAFSLRDSALSASQRYPSLPFVFLLTPCAARPFSTFNCRLSTSHTTMLKSYRRFYDHP
jgi:hypothetical protein